MTRYYGSDGKPLGCSGYYRKGDKFRMSLHCYGCHIKINYIHFGYLGSVCLPELQHPEAIQRDGEHHHCWMPCISPHYEMVYVEDGETECQSIS